MKIHGAAEHFATSRVAFSPVKSSKAFGCSAYVDSPTKKDIEKLIRWFEPLLTMQMEIVHGEDSEATLR